MLVKNKKGISTLSVYACGLSTCNTNACWSCASVCSPSTCDCSFYAECPTASFVSSSVDQNSQSETTASIKEFAKNLSDFEGIMDTK